MSSKAHDKNQKHTMNMDQFTKAEIQALHDEMEEGGKLEFIFKTGLVWDKSDNLSDITIDQLISAGLTKRESEIFVCAVAASARSDWKTTQLALYLAAKP